MNSFRLEGPSLFTLVTYAPKPLREWVMRVRRELLVEADSQPHLTILPPRPLLIPPEQAKERITAILGGWQSFDIELCGVRVFPNSNVLYLEVGEGSNTLRRLHDELGTSDFAHDEIFEFHPHVTIGGPVPVTQLESNMGRAVASWDRSSCPSHFAIEHIAFVSIPAGQDRSKWRRLWEYKLCAPKTYARLARTAVTGRTF